MKKTLIALLVLACGAQLFAGTFFANHLVLDCDRTAVETYIATQNLRVIGIHADLDAVKEVLTLSAFEDDYVFAEDVLEELRILFNLPESIYLGYTYAKEMQNDIMEYGFSYSEW